MLRPLRKMILEFHFIRHAETVANRDNILQGHCDYPLTELGIEFTKHTGEALANERWTLAFTSDLQRAVTTSGIIMSKNCYPIEIVPLQLIRELYFGVRETLPRGTTVDEARAIVAQQRGIDISAVVDTSESSDHVTERQQKFVDYVFDRFEANPSLLSGHVGDGPPKIFVLSHGGYIRSFLRSYCKNPEIESIEKIKNCSISKVVIDKHLGSDGVMKYSYVANKADINCVM